MLNFSKSKLKKPVAGRILAQVPFPFLKWRMEFSFSLSHFFKEGKKEPHFKNKRLTALTTVLYHYTYLRLLLRLRNGASSSDTDKENFFFCRLKKFVVKRNMKVVSLPRQRLSSRA